MHNITIVFSHHSIRGNCNPSALYKIIEEIQPQVIFEELPTDIFNKIYLEGYEPKSLEAITVKKYIESHKVMNIPVDTYKTKGVDFFDNFEIFLKHSNEYKKLCEEQLLKINNDGYSFINSERNFEILDKLKSIEEKILSKINEEELSISYAKDKKQHSNRDIEMLQNIYSFSKQQKYLNAIFICGADHRNSLIEKIS